jgi:hypothetical protein
VSTTRQSARHAPLATVGLFPVRTFTSKRTPHSLFPIDAECRKPLTHFALVAVSLVDRRNLLTGFNYRVFPLLTELPTSTPSDSSARTDSSPPDLRSSANSPRLLLHISWRVLFDVDRLRRRVIAVMVVVGGRGRPNKDGHRNHDGNNSVLVTTMKYTSMHPAYVRASCMRAVPLLRIAGSDSGEQRRQITALKNRPNLKARNDRSSRIILWQPSLPPPPRRATPHHSYASPEAAARRVPPRALAHHVARWRRNTGPKLRIPIPGRPDSFF